MTLVRAITSFGKVEKRLKNATGQPKKEVLKVVNPRKVGEVQEGATCFCDKKLSKFG